MAATVPPVAHVYFGKPMLPDVSRVLACLYEKDIAFELVDMYEGHRMPADILKLQVLCTSHVLLSIRYQTGASLQMLIPLSRPP